MEKWNESILVAQAAYARITQRGQKWQQRRIPIYIRENLMVPFYVTVAGNQESLFAIQYPEKEGEKVRFENVARRRFDEATTFPSFPKQVGEIA